MTYPSQEVEIRQVDQVSSDRQQPTDFSRQPEMDARTAMTRPAVQFSHTTSENTVTRPDSGHQQNTTATVQVRTPETGSTELETIETVYHTARRVQRVAERSQRLNRHKEPKKGRSYSTIVKNPTTMASLNNDTRKERRKRMQKRARPDIRHAILTARLSEPATRWRQKWARLNIYRLKSRTTRRRMPEVVQLNVPLVTRSCNQRAHPEIRQQRIKDVTGRRIRVEWMNHTHLQIRV